MHFIRRLVVAATALIAVAGATVLATAAPAQAYEPYCWWTYSDETGWTRHCIELEIPVDPYWWIKGCPACWVVFDPHDDWLKEVDQLELGDRLADVILYSAAARYAEDPEAAAFYREMVVKAGLESVELIDGNEFTMERVGWYDAESGEFSKAEEELLWYASDEVTAAFAQFQKAGGDPDSESVDAALEHMANAIEALTVPGKG